MRHPRHQVLLAGLIAVSVTMVLCAQPVPGNRPQPLGRGAGRDGAFGNAPFPDVTACTEDGQAVKLPDLFKDKYTVLVTGCLTCPIFRGSYPGVEALARDYGAGDVQFFYLYKTLAHPEFKGYVAPQNLAERLRHIAQARKELGTSIPWLCDTMTDDVKRALNAGPNSEYLIAPDGQVIYSSHWSDAQALRVALTAVKGPVESPTLPSELGLPDPGRSPRPPQRETATRVVRPNGLVTLKLKPAKPEETYYVKLRAEAEPALLSTGKGRLYLGFFPDPVLGAHWNNLVDPLQFTLSLPEGVRATPSSATAARVDADSDSGPREFWVGVEAEAPPQSVQLSMSYFGCTDKRCEALTQKYTILFERDNFGGWTFGFHRAQRPGDRARPPGQRPGPSAGPRPGP
jgi:hypothetical protein